MDVSCGTFLAQPLFPVRAKQIMKLASHSLLLLGAVLATLLMAHQLPGAAANHTEATDSSNGTSSGFLDAPQDTLSLTSLLKRKQHGAPGNDKIEVFEDEDDEDDAEDCDAPVIVTKTTKTTTYPSRLTRSLQVTETVKPTITSTIRLTKTRKSTKSPTSKSKPPKPTPKPTKHTTKHPKPKTKHTKPRTKPKQTKSPNATTKKPPKTHTKRPHHPKDPTTRRPPRPKPKDPTTSHRTNTQKPTKHTKPPKPTKSPKPKPKPVPLLERVKMQTPLKVCGGIYYRGKCQDIYPFIGQTIKWDYLIGSVKVKQRHVLCTGSNRHKKGAEGTVVRFPGYLDLSYRDVNTLMCTIPKPLFTVSYCKGKHGKGSCRTEATPVYKCENVKKSFKHKISTIHLGSEGHKLHVFTSKNCRGREKTLKADHSGKLKGLDDKILSYKIVRRCTDQDTGLKFWC